MRSAFRMKWIPRSWVGLLGAALAAGAEPTSKEAPTATNEISADALYETGKDLFDTYAPPEVKEQFEFPDRARWDDFVARLQRALDGDDPAALVQLEPETRATAATLRQVPGSADYLGWLDERLDYIEAAKEIVRQPPQKPPVAAPGQFIPNYDLWLSRMQARSRPAGAEKYVPLLKPIFATGGVPGELVWLAEVESGFNPTSRSPSGARGQFQLLPATAKELGLSTFLPDERTDPAKSARAASRLLRDLHAKFGDWPLALAAYNAGAGRVQRSLSQRQARTFAEIAPALSVETRLYVPKVLATLQARTGVSLADTARP